jgi:hypothetical protein
MKQILFLVLIMFAACQSKPALTNEILYYNGDILTMEGDTPSYVEALAVRDGRIVFTGTQAVAEKLFPRATKKDLGGKTLLPGFIDAHSHLMMYADAVQQAKLNPPPVGMVRSIKDIIKELRELKQREHLSDTSWLVGTGYDQDFLEEKRHPTAEDLDADFPSNPVVIMHTSSHMLVANSEAMRRASITAKTQNPAGGTILRKKGTQEPEGLIQEMAMYQFAPFLLRKKPKDIERANFRKAQEYYASCGVTTAAEHLAMPDKMNFLNEAATDSALFIDLEVLPSFLYARDYIGTGKVKWGRFNNHLKYAGLKLTLDGSPQGKTAFLIRPYLTAVPGCTSDCRGFSSLTQQQVNDLFLLCYKNQVQLYAHCNGDAAIDMMIEGHEWATKSISDTASDRRTIIIHSQIMRQDQLDAYLRYGMIPTFFTNHTYYWGDVHLANLGAERADFISPMKAAISKGIHPTNHTDCTVTPMDQLFLLWSSVNRLSRSGRIMGEAQRVSTYEGLQAQTIYGAYEYFEESSKGSLKEGKMADFVILDRNPIKVDPMLIKEIVVLETVKEGKTIFMR